MPNIGEKVISILAGYLNLGCSYLITTVNRPYFTNHCSVHFILVTCVFFCLFVFWSSPIFICFFNVYFYWESKFLIGQSRNFFSVKSGFEKKKIIINGKHRNENYATKVMKK
jgi:hypothetical protein